MEYISIMLNETKQPCTDKRKQNNPAQHYLDKEDADYIRDLYFNGYLKATELAKKYKTNISVILRILNNSFLADSNTPIPLSKEQIKANAKQVTFKMINDKLKKEYNQP